jgi:hypothetical protein
MADVIQKPWLSPTPASIWFDHVAAVTLGGNATETLIEFDIPLASRGIIKWLGQDIPTGRWSDVKWQLKINGGPDTVYGSIVGEISKLYDPTETFILIPRSSKVQLVAQNLTAVGSLQVLGRLKGWYWPEKD